MRHAVCSIIAILAVLSACANVQQPATLEQLQKQVADTERGFARTMAERNHAGFTAYLADEAIFFSGQGVPQRGRQTVAEAWRRFYEKPEAPFSWEPEIVQVLDSGTLAISSGPVRDPSGKIFAQFSSIWRLESPGVWRIIFDKGNPVCDCAKP